MIFDSHCHAWRNWPYDDHVPDGRYRASVDSLLWEMDEAGVGRAAVVCARMGRDVGERAANDDNNDYVAAAVAAHPDRLVMIGDVDGLWCPSEHHVPGAAGRLRAAVERYGLVAFTHYVHEDSDGWFASPEGLEFFGAAAELGLVASLGMSPSWQPDLRRIAEAFPAMPILVHHQGMARLHTATFDADLAAVLANADLPNIFVKVSGFHYLAHEAWEYPFPEVHERVLKPLQAAYTPARLLWGSDFAAARPYVTYRQSLEVVRSHAAGLSPAEQDRILGGNLEGLLRERRVKQISERG
jgi:L-fuconolactonase